MRVMIACAAAAVATAPAGAGEFDAAAAQTVFAAWVGVFDGVGEARVWGAGDGSMEPVVFELTGQPIEGGVSLLSTINPPVSAVYAAGGMRLTGYDPLDGARAIDVEVSAFEADAAGGAWRYSSAWTQPGLDGAMYDFREIQSYADGVIERFVEAAPAGADGPWSPAYVVKLTPK